MKQTNLRFLLTAPMGLALQCRFYSKCILIFFLLLQTTLAVEASPYRNKIGGIYYVLYRDFYGNNDRAYVTYCTEDSLNRDTYKGTVIIPSTVKDNGYTFPVIAIDSKAFCYCSELNRVVLPSSIERIGDDSFQGCSGLATVSIPEKVTSIGSLAFDGCATLKSITIPRNVTTIGQGVFRGCSNLQNIIVENGNTVYDSRQNSNAIIQTSENKLVAGCNNTMIPNGITSIGWNAFSGSGIVSVTIPEGVRSIGSGAFAGCNSLTSVHIANSVTNIEAGAFMGCSRLCFIQLPNALQQIDMRMFEDCISLPTIDIPASVEKISSFAFYNCSGLKSLYLSSHLVSIEDRAFQGCYGLESIQVDKENQVFSSRDNCNAILSGNTLIQGCKNTVIPNGVTQIGYGAFWDCSTLESITIPSSVTEIKEYAFHGCSSLSSIKVESGNATYDSRSNCNAIIKTLTNTLMVGGNQTVIPEGVNAIGSDAFNKRKWLKGVRIPKSVRSIGKYAFQDCEGLESVHLCDGLKKIEQGAFNGCAALQSVDIPDGVTEIYRETFSGCSSLNHISLPSTLSKLEYGALKDCDNLKHVELFCSWLVETDRTYATPISQYFGNSVEEYTIGNNCHRIGDFVFYKSPKLKTIVIPNSIETIGQYAFAENDELQEVVIPNSVTSIDYHAFENCLHIYSITSLINIPFSLKAGVFAYLYDGYDEDIVYRIAKLYVPRGRQEAYAATTGWKKFLNILETDTKYKLTYMLDGEVYKTYEIQATEVITPEPDPYKEGYSFSGWNGLPYLMPAHDVIVQGSFGSMSDIVAIASQRSVVPIAYYSIGGRRCNTLMPGLNIVIMSDGTTRKVLMK